MENKELKDKIQKNVRENIAISAIKEEINMKKIKNKKVFYSVLSTAAMFMICMVVIVGNKINIGKKENSNIALKQDKQQGTEDLRTEKLETKLNINKIDDKIGLLKIDADVKIIGITKLPEEFNFIKNIKIPEDYKLNDNYYNIYVKSNMNVAEYDKLHDYVFRYEKDNTNDIKIAFSKVEEPIRDYRIEENGKKSIVAGVDMIIYHSQKYKMYMAEFKCNDIYFDIETNDITENELVELLESIVGEVKQEIPVKDEDVGSIEQPKEILNDVVPHLQALLM